MKVLLTPSDFDRVEFTRRWDLHFEIGAICLNYLTVELCIFLIQFQVLHFLFENPVLFTKPFHDFFPPFFQFIAVVDQLTHSFYFLLQIFVLSFQKLGIVVDFRK